MSKINGLITICIVLVVFASCKKHRAKKLAGRYECAVSYFSYDVNTPSSLDTTFLKTIEVIRNKRHLEVLNKKIHIDSIWDGQLYRRGTTDNYFTVYLDQNKLIYNEVTSKNGKGRTINYDGFKKDE